LLSFKSRWLIVLLFLVACSGSSDATVLFEDEFVVGQSGNWITEGDVVGKTAVIDERLLIQIDQPNTMQFATLEDPLFTDFDLTVDARLLAGDVESSYGILFRMQDLQQFYRFEVTGTGMYVIERRNVDGTWLRLVQDWTETPALNQGLAVTNQLRVAAYGAVLTFYANGTLLQQVQDAQFKAGAIALDAGTFGQGGLQVAFDNVVVRSLGP
jgi:hypothetical protein